MTDVPRSALYEGWVSHRRGDGLDAEFRRRIALALVELDQLDEVLAQSPLAGRSPLSPLRFRRADYIGDPEVPLSDTVLDVSEAATGRRAAGPVLMLGKLRTWGWLFNPLVVFFVYDRGRLDSLVLAVSSTPWHERTTYTIDALEGCDGRGSAHNGDKGCRVAGRVAKRMHVSPFLPMDLDYRVTVDEPADRMLVRIECVRGETTLLDATMLLHRRGRLDRRALARLALRHGLGALSVSVGIYRHAARWKLRGARFHRHPGRQVGDDRDDPSPAHRRPGRRVRAGHR